MSLLYTLLLHIHTLHDCMHVRDTGHTHPHARHRDCKLCIMGLHDHNGSLVEEGEGGKASLV